MPRSAVQPAIIARADYNNALAGRGMADRSVASVDEAKVLMDNVATDLARYEKLLA